MTNRDILNALGDIDESYITEANGRIKSKKGICRSEADTARQNEKQRHHQ